MSWRELATALPLEPVDVERSYEAMGFALIVTSAFGDQGLEHLREALVEWLHVGQRGGYGKPMRSGQEIELALGGNAAGERFVCWLLDLDFSDDGLVALVRILDHWYRNDLKFRGESSIVRFKFGDIPDELAALRD